MLPVVLQFEDKKISFHLKINDKFLCFK